MEIEGQDRVRRHRPQVRAQSSVTEHQMSFDLDSENS